MWGIYTLFNVIYLECNNADVVKLLKFMSTYFEVCIKYEYLQCTLVPLHIYTRDIRKAWPIHVRRLD